MNERLKELLEQAHEQKPVIVLDPETCQPTHKIGNGGVPMYHSELNPEKFAKLIIQKCISQIALIGVSNFENEDIMWTVETAIDNIETHFGVTE